MRDEYVGPFNLLTRSDYAAKAKATANSYLTTITKAAKTAGIEADIVAIASDRPHEAIIKTAKRKKCDLIIMGSHGRSGVAGILLGSVTQKVLSHSTHTGPRAALRAGVTMSEMRPMAGRLCPLL